MKCKKCGFENKIESRRCENCGKKLKRNGFLVFLVVILIMALIYFVGINAVSYYMYNEPAGFLPNIKKEEPKQKKTTKKETKKKEKEVLTKEYTVNLFEMEVDKKIDFDLDDDFTVSFLAKSLYDGIYTYKMYINNKEITDLDENAYLDKANKDSQSNIIKFTRFGDTLLYEGQGRTDIKQLNLYAFYKDGKVELFKNEEIDTDLDMYPYSFEVKDNKLVIEGRRSYHGPSIIYNNSYYGVCREEQEGVGLAKDLPQNLAVIKKYYYDSSLKQVDTKTTQTLSQYLEENSKYCGNN